MGYYVKYKNNKRTYMPKIRMNTEYRNKLYNRIKDVFEKEETQERQAFMEARETFTELQTHTFDVARAVIERAYPSTDVATLRHFKKKYGNPCGVGPDSGGGPDLTPAKPPLAKFSFKNFGAY